MKNFTLILLTTSAGLPLAGCDKQSVPAANDTITPTAIQAAAVASTGTGTVTAVYQASGKVTLDHGPIPGAGWPAMKMTFEADPGMLKGVKAGDHVRFGMRTAGGRAEDHFNRGAVTLGAQTERGSTASRRG